MTIDVTGWSSAVGVIRDAGIIGLLVAILYGGFKGWWVFGRSYDELRDERDSWRTIALNSQGTTEKAVDLAETHVGLARMGRR